MQPLVCVRSGKANSNCTMPFPSLSLSLSGMIWSECKEIWTDGPREYVMHLWNVLDFGMLSIFVASFTARFMAFLKASKAQLYIDLHVPNHDISNASLPADIAYFTYGEGTTLHKRFKLTMVGGCL